VKFVQVTRGDTHSFKMHFFSSFCDHLKKIEKLDFVIELVEIYFLVPMKNINNFSLSYSQVIGHGLLQQYKTAQVNWKQGSEHNQIKFRGIQGFDH
jgi:hypothetical protein